MRMAILLSGLLSIFLGTFVFAQSQPLPGTPDAQNPVSASENPLEIKGRLFAYYYSDESGSGSLHKRGFDLDRAYLQINYKFDSQWSSVALLDANHSETDTGANSKRYNLIYLRNAYVQAVGLGLEGSTFRFGLQPYFYTTIEAASGTRWLAKTLGDEFFTEFAPTHNGAISYKFPVFGIVDLGVALNNGNESVNQHGSDSNDGLGQAAYADFKIIQNGTDVISKAGIVVHFESHDEFNANPALTAQTKALLTGLYLNSSILDLTSEFITANRDRTIGAKTDKTYSAYAVTVNAKLDKWSFYLRHISSADDDTKKELLKAKSVLTIGPTYTLVKNKLQTGLTFETRTAFDDTTVALTGVPAGKDAKIIQWRWLAQF